MSTSVAYADTWDYGVQNDFGGVISQLTQAAYYNSQEQLSSSSNFSNWSITKESYRSQFHINVFVENFMEMINFVDTKNLDHHELFQPNYNNNQSAARIKLVSGTEAELMKTSNGRKLRSYKSIQSSVTYSGPLRTRKLDRIESDGKRVIITKPYLSCKSILSEVTYGGPLPRKPRR
jgi:hypothetical protein